MDSDSNRSTDVPHRAGTNDEQRFGPLSRIIILVITTTLIWFLILYINELSFGSGYTRIGHILNAVLATALAVPMVVLARRILDNRPLAGLGLPPMRTGWRSFLVGMGGYLLPAGLALVGALILGQVDISLDTSLTDMITRFLGLVILVFLYEALPEELVFRGYIYRNLSTVFPRWAAVVGQAVLFSLFGAALWAVGPVFPGCLDGSSSSFSWRLSSV